jgi:hypothetical protein
VFYPANGGLMRRGPEFAVARVPDGPAAKFEPAIPIVECAAPEQLVFGGVTFSFMVFFLLDRQRRRAGVGLLRQQG